MLLLALSIALAGPPVSADDPAAIKAEAVRLVAEIKSHAADGKSAGVEREYRRLLSLGVRVDPELHVLAADVARNQGDSLKALARLYRVPAGSRQSAQVQAFRENLLERYAYVRVSLKPGVEVEVPSLFSPDEARAAQRLAEVVSESGVYIGLVPEGDYSFDGRRYRFSARKAFQIPPPPQAPGEMAASPPAQGASTSP